MSPSGSKDQSTEGDHPWEQDKYYGASESGVAYLADRELRTSNADTEMMPAVKASALAEPVADAGTGQATAVEAATATATASKATPVAAAKTAKTAKTADVPSPPGNRVSKPVVAAAAVAGLVLLSVPVLIAGLLQNDDTPTRALPNPAAYEDDAQAQSGFIPGMAQEQPVPPPGLPAGNLVPGPPPGSPNNGAPVPPPAGGEIPRGEVQPAVPADPARTAAHPVVFSGFAGPGCGSGSFSRPGYFTKGNEGWLNSGGAHAADGCDGSYSSLPMSGDPNRDGDNSAVWRFTTGDVKQGSCQVSVFVPRGDVMHVGGDPSYYTVYQGDETKGPSGDFRVFQANRQGSWVDGGRFAITSGRLTIKLHSRGKDWTDKGPTYAHHAAAQMKIDCSA
ncbi:hypothetical protein AB0L13_21315 [Saccharopolyspora shandongensis]|uniref:hypothetical protein n=1 Tax=Saccharopolyspora shandongensis TaxID=418495 RepID=UPI0034397318